MIKVFESFDLSFVGQLQSLLEAHGIRTFLKNQFSAGALGELPFVEICPQLYILAERDLEQARMLLQVVPRGPEPADWDCAACGARSEGNFAQCWQCGAARPAT